MVTKCGSKDRRKAAARNFDDDVEQCRSVRCDADAFSNTCRKLKPSSRGELELPRCDRDDDRRSMRRARGRCARLLERRRHPGRFGIARASCSSRRTEMNSMESRENWDARGNRASRSARGENSRINPASEAFRGACARPRESHRRAHRLQRVPVMPIAIDRSTIIVAARATTRTSSCAMSIQLFPREFLLEARYCAVSPRRLGQLRQGWNPRRHRSFSASAAGDRKDARRHDDRRRPRASGRGSFVIGGADGFLGARDDGASTASRQDALETAQMVARSEWYVGTMAGGMDQAASMLGRRDHALLIHFDPLRVNR